MVSPLPSSVPEWTLQPGQAIRRKELHEIFGGRTQGGIGPSAKTPNVFLFTDRAAGKRYGYEDDWMSDGLFDYTGEGQQGDQQMKSGNASVLDHRKDGRALRLFQGARGTVTYLGQFEVAEEEPWYPADARDARDGYPLRQVIIFRLRPIDTAAQPPRTSLAKLLADTQHVVQAVPLEQQLTERTFVNPAPELYEAERKEASLVHTLGKVLREKGHTVDRPRILPAGERRPLFGDLHDHHLNLLVEAKSSPTRENVRMAIGQLADYGRFLPTARLAILLPTEPRLDLIELAHSQDIVVLWLIGDKVESSRPDFSLDVGQP
ncbi:hypothetical protein [Nonomuraea sp. SBT364]|uniref:hypothetical protein n=1 Tax=Nonomuraea sp. SBT364 TaxID=1580530 RepID=UPI00066D4690|nr:hypothetical protein [Nonomuraea sp. SBT364]